MLKIDKGVRVMHVELVHTLEFCEMERCVRCYDRFQRTYFRNGGKYTSNSNTRCTSVNAVWNYKWSVIRLWGRGSLLHAESIVRGLILRMYLNWALQDRQSFRRQGMVQVKVLRWRGAGWVGGGCEVWPLCDMSNGKYWGYYRKRRQKKRDIYMAVDHLMYTR